MSNLTNKEVIEASSLFLDLSKGLLEKLDDFLTDLNDEQKVKIIDISELIFSEGFTSGMVD